MEHPELSSDGGGPGDGVYNEAYFAAYGDLGEPYAWGSPGWESFFGRIADAVVTAVQPDTVLDVGCAIGLLVGAFRARGVEAWGIDVSQHALEHVRADLKPYCVRHSISDGLRGHYDLVTAIEVFEHLAPAESERAFDEVTSHADAVLFSSTPTLQADPTHLDERPPAEWLEAFARRGFYRDFGFDAQIVAPGAFLVRREQRTNAQLVAGYERERTRIDGQLRALQARTARARARVLLLRLRRRAR